MPLATVEALLPASEADAVVVSAALMELGALVCTARAPRCAACPLADDCAWLAADRPAPRQRRRTQAYAGTDRQVRGAMLALLRESRDAAVPVDVLLAACRDPEQAARALDGLLADGLVERADDAAAVRLPG
jgi:A/G-specific adenine glycosylase